MQEGNALAVGEELRRGFEAGVAAAYHYHILVGKERAVARSAVGEPFLVVLGRARNLELTPVGTGRDESERGGVLLAVFQYHVDVGIVRFERLRERGGMDS